MVVIELRSQDLVLNKQSHLVSFDDNKGFMTRLDVVLGLKLVDIFPILCWHVSFLGCFFSAQRASCSCAHDPNGDLMYEFSLH